MPDRDASFLSGGAGSGSGLEEGGGVGGAVGGGGGVIMGGGGALGNGGGAGCGNGGSGLALDGVCRDYVRNVCKRGKRCRFRHPDVNSVPDLGVQKNEFVFCHDHQNKECMRSSCRFVHGSKEDEDHYKKTGELPQRLRGRVAARLGLSPTDLPHSRGEVPICRDFLKGECQRGNKCKFRHVQKDYEYETTHHHPALGGGAMGGNTLLGGGGAMGGPGGVGGGGGPNGAGSMMGGLNCGGGLLGGVNGGSCGGMVGLVGGGGGTVMGMGGTIPIRDPPGGMSGGLGGGGGGMGGCLSALGSLGQRRYDRGGATGAGGGPWGEPLFDGSGAGLFEAGGGGGGPLEAVDPHHLTLQLKRRRMEALGHYELQTPTLQPHAASRPLMEFRFLEEENSLLRKRVEELKKQVSNLMATNEVLLEQNAQFRSQAKVMTLTSTPAPGSEQSLVPGPPMVAAVSSYNHGIAQTHTTLSSAPQRGPVTQQELVVVASTESNAPAPLNPEISCPLSAALVQTLGMGAPAVVSMAPVAVSVAPVVSVSMAQAMPGITMSHAPSQAMPGITMSHAPTTPMVSYPIASQSMRITSLPH